MAAKQRCRFKFVALKTTINQDRSNRTNGDDPCCAAIQVFGAAAS